MAMLQISNANTDSIGDQLIVPDVTACASVLTSSFSSMPSRISSDSPCTEHLRFRLVTAELPAACGLATTAARSASTLAMRAGFSSGYLAPIRKCAPVRQPKSSGARHCEADVALPDHGQLVPGNESRAFKATAKSSEPFFDKAASKVCWSRTCGHAAGADAPLLWKPAYSKQCDYLGLPHVI